MKDPEPSQDPLVLRRILTDTGVLARELLGYNYDEDAGGHKLNVGKGGIRPDGKTQEIVELIDDTSLRYKLVMVPRDGRKSTLAQCLCIRRILHNPDIRIFYCGRTDDIVRNKSIAIRNQMERPEVTKLFGLQKGPKWEEMSWTVGDRDHAGLQNTTFTAFSQDSIPTGGRCNVLILDDFIDHNNVATPEQNKKSKDRWKLLQPLIAKGCEVIVFCTLWADDDLSSDLRRSRLFAPPTGGQVVCGAGVRVVEDGKGGYDLEVIDGGLTFPHLTIEYLREKLHAMSIDGDVRPFVFQYLNETPTIGGSGFQRHQFQSLSWENDMEQLSGFLLTDTAIGEEASSCFSVLAYVGLDAADNIYLLDLRVGNWQPSEFCDNFFETLEEWQAKVNHCGEAWEAVALATAYRAQIEADSRSRKTKLRTIEMKRPSRSHKPDRIKRLQPPFRKRQFFVVNTVPRTFTDVTGERVLWDPIGFWNADKKVFEPAGELVDEFLRESSKKDIPDTLAMILEYSKGRYGQRRLCQHKPWRPREKYPSLTEQRRDAYHAEHYGPANTDWWDRTLREQGI